MTTKDKSQISRLVNEGMIIDAEIKARTKRLNEIKKTLVPIAQERYDANPGTVVLKGSDAICSVSFATSLKVPGGASASEIRGALGEDAVVEAISYKLSKDATAEVLDSKKLQGMVHVTVTPKCSFNAAS